MSPFPDLSNRNVLITGASSGIGRRLALSAAAAGARVAVGARRVDRLHTLVAEIAAGGGHAVAVALDVEDEASLIAGFAAAEDALGELHTVYANAGINRGPGFAVEQAAEDFDAVFRVNTRGAFLTAREAGRRMIAAGTAESGRGRVVLVGSIGGQVPLPGLVAYCASKAAVISMGRGLAREWARKGINVNVVCPGYIETELTGDWFSTDGGRRQVAGFPRRRLIPEGGLDPLLLFLGSDASAAITGGVFTADDGQTL